MTSISPSVESPLLIASSSANGSENTGVMGVGAGDCDDVGSGGDDDVDDDGGDCM